ncbi:MAG: ABC transporter ATP-binding protein [Chloroflexi bacterium]|nr:ABC transporter ATP-binding protein [Chloroflexota bacterium]
MNVYMRVLGYLRPYWLLQVVAYLAMLGINGVILYRPQLIRRVVDVGIGEGNLDALGTSVVLIVGLTGLQGVFRFVEAYSTEWVSQSISYKMRNQLYERLVSLSFRYHDASQAGQLLSRTTSDVDRLRRFTGRSILGLVQAIVLLVSTTVILVRMNATLALLSLVVMPIILVYMKRYVDRTHPLWHRRQDQVGVLTSRLEQNLHGMSVVRGFAQEDAERQRFGDENDKVFDITMDVAKVNSFAMPFVLLLAHASAVVIVWLGGRYVVAGALTLGELIAFNAYVMQLIGPIRRLSFLASMLGESRASAERVFEVLDAESEVEEAPDAQPLEDIRGGVTFDHVSFRYQDGFQALQDVDFDVPAGSIVALLGPTGSGKSTVTNLIPRFYDVSEGRILVDGVDIRTVMLDSLRKRIGMVLQETMLFATTIRENIAFGRTDATQEEIEQAAKAAAAHDFIMSFPEGYETYVGERGATLSGGQRQRVAIARALLMDPRILILDDATSSVDTETEQQIQRALANLMEGRTSFIIAQRVSTVRNADLILVIDKGKLVARGKHEELIQQSGIYAEIYHRQLKQETGDPAPALSGRSS